MITMRTLSDHILDILENSVRASANLIEIMISENKNSDLYTVEIRDDGCGMTQETAQKALQPFFTSRTTRKVGLGLPLLLQNAERTGGNLTIESAPGNGACIHAEFGLTHIDRPCLGDMAGVFLLSVIGHPEIIIKYEHSTDKGTFTISSQEIKEVLGDVPLNTAEMRQAVRELIHNNLEMIQALK
jgi:hypothetical protein